MFCDEILQPKFCEQTYRKTHNADVTTQLALMMDPLHL
jgi:hypothetical protein